MLVLEYSYVELYNNLTRVGTVGSRDWYVQLFFIPFIHSSHTTHSVHSFLTHDPFRSFIPHTRPISFIHPSHTTHSVHSSLTHDPFRSFIPHTRPISFVFSIIQNKLISFVLKINVNCPLSVKLFVQ